MLLRIREMERRLREAAIVNATLTTRLCQFEQQLVEDRIQGSEIVQALSEDNRLLQNELQELHSDLATERSRSDYSCSWTSCSEMTEARCRLAEEGQSGGLMTSQHLDEEDPAEVEEGRLMGSDGGQLVGLKAPTQEFVTSSQDEEVIAAMRKEPCTVSVSVHCATQDGTAKSGAEHFCTAGVLRFEPGEQQKSVVVESMGEITQKANESHFLMKLFNPPWDAKLQLESVCVNLISAECDVDESPDGGNSEQEDPTGHC